MERGNLNDNKQPTTWSTIFLSTMVTNPLMSYQLDHANPTFCDEN